MRNNKYRILIIAILVLQTVSVFVVFAFLYNYVTNPSSDFNKNLAQIIRSQVANFTPLQGPKGDKGDKGDTVVGDDGEDGNDGQPGKDGAQGPTGAQGAPGVNGINGTSVTAEQIAAAVAQYLAANPPAAGAKGDKGDTGPQGERADFKCNADMRVLEYKYPSDEDWTSTGAACIPTVGETQQ